MKEGVLVSLSDTHLAAGREEDTTNAELLREFTDWVSKDGFLTAIAGDVYDYYQSAGFKNVVMRHPEIHTILSDGMNSGRILPVNGNHDPELLKHLRGYVKGDAWKKLKRSFYTSDWKLRIPDMQTDITHGHEFEASYNFIIGKPWERYMNWLLGRIEQYIWKDIDAWFAKKTRDLRKGILEKFDKAAAEMLTKNKGYPIRIIGHTHTPDFKVIDKGEDGKPLIYTPDDIDLSEPVEFELGGKMYLLNDGACVNGRCDYLVLVKLDRRKYRAAYMRMSDGMGTAVLKKYGVLD